MKARNPETRPNENANSVPNRNYATLSLKAYFATDNTSRQYFRSVDRAANVITHVNGDTNGGLINV